MHGDVKPGNIVFKSSGGAASWKGSAVLMDFGIVRPLERTVSTLWATPSYAAPEVLLGRAVDGRVDVYGLGLVLHDLVEGRRPGSPGLAAERRDTRLADVAPQVDRDLSAIGARATDAEPCWPYALVADLESGLQAWLKRDPASARFARHPSYVLDELALGASILLASATVLLAASSARSLLADLREVRERWAEDDLGAALGSIPPLLVFP